MHDPVSESDSPWQQAAGYCRSRRDLEQLLWTLSSRLSAVTERLVSSIGRNHETFLIAQSDCAEIRAEISQLRQRMVEHRSLHGC
jgi:hypothetical protein